MKTLLSAFTCVVLLPLWFGCSKSQPPTAEVPPPDPAAAMAPTTPAQAATAASLQSLPEVTKAIQAGQYDAVQKIVELRPATPQMTDAQRLQYQQAVRDATSALLNSMNSDPAAKAAYEKLSRAATGR